jgi:hypothetical protein
MNAMNLLRRVGCQVAVVIVTLAVLWPGRVAAQPEAPAPASEVAKLREEIAELRQRIERKEVEQTAATQTFDKRLEEIRDASRLYLRAGRLSLLVNGFIQVDMTAYRSSSKDQLDAAGEPQNQVRFLLRRARIRTMAEYRWLFGAFEIDANTNNGLQVRPQSFEVGVKYANPHRSLPYIAVHMGLVRSPFGFEVQQSDKDRLFLERSVMFGAWYPGEYDLGVRAFGGWRMLRYAIAGMNGDPIGEKSFPGRDPNQSKDLIAYVGVEQYWKVVGVRGGVSADYGEGFHKGTPASGNSLGWTDTNMDGVVDPGEITGIPGAAATPSQNFRRWGIGVDAALSFRIPKLGTLWVMGEVVYGYNMDRNIVIADPVAAKRNLKELGWYAAFTQELTPYAAVGLRFDEYDPDREAVDASGAPLATVKYQQWVATAMAQLPGYAKFFVEYGHVQKPNGRASDGTPIALNDHMFTLRAMLLF